MSAVCNIKNTYVAKVQRTDLGSAIAILGIWLICGQRDANGKRQRGQSDGHLILVFGGSVAWCIPLRGVGSGYSLGCRLNCLTKYGNRCLSALVYNKFSK